MRALKIAGAAIAAVIVVAALLLIIGVPSSYLTSEITARVERETGYRLTIAGSTRIGIWPSLNVTLSDLTLQDPKDRDTSSRLTVGKVEADITLASVWSGRPQVTELVITKPVLSVPLLRERSGQMIASPKPASPEAADAKAPVIDRVTVTDGTIVFSSLRDRVENRVDGINVSAVIGSDRKVTVTGSARAGEHPLKFAIKATAPPPPLERQNIPTEITLEAPSLLQAPLATKAEVRLNGSIVMINGVTGTVGDGAFNGWASVDVASKPLVKLDLDFQRLAVATAAKGGGSASAPWSNATIDLTGLNYIDAQARISAAELNIGEARFAPAAIDATLGSGVLRTQVSNLGAYGGQANGELMVDASTANPAYTLRADLTNVRALPLLKSAADFDKLDGKMQTKISVRSTGNSQRAIMANLNGTVFAIFQDGAIRGLNVAQMIRSLTTSTQSGWQENKEQTTDLSQLSASFKIDKGQAVTTDLNLVGPLVKMTGAGTIALDTKMMAFRVEPKLVLTTEGQGRAADPVGFGIPVIIDGSWAEPRIYPEMSGILENPDAAYAKLKEMGKGLFGQGGAGLDVKGLGGLLGGLGGSGSTGTAPGSTAPGSAASDPLGGKLGETLGNLLQQGLGGLNQGGAGQSAPAPSGRSQGRSIPRSDSSAPAEQAAPPPPPAAAQTDIPQATPDSQAMNEVLRQLFNR